MLITQPLAFLLIVNQVEKSLIFNLLSNAVCKPDILLICNVGISPSDKVVPDTTLPYISVVTLVYVPAVPIVPNDMVTFEDNVPPPESPLPADTLLVLGTPSVIP